MTYEGIATLLETMSIDNCAIAWISENPVPDIFIRYYLVDDNTFTHYNETETELLQARYTFVVYDKKGTSLESTFATLQTTLENKSGFSTFEDISDSYENDTGHRSRQGDIMYYRRKD